MEKKRSGAATKQRRTSKDQQSEKKSVDMMDPTMVQRMNIERAFTQCAEGKHGIEIYKLRLLLKRNRDEMKIS